MAAAKPAAKPDPRTIMAEINSVLKTKALMMGSDPSLVVKYIPTGVLPMDILLGGGLPRGRSTELYGGYSSLKSYIGLSAIAEAQAAGGTAGLIDTEHAFDPEWATSIGVDVSQMFHAVPETGEEAADICEALLRQDLDLIVWDSVAATLPKAEALDDKGNIKRMTDKTQMARLAFFMSQALRKLNTANRHTAMLWINQTRINVGQMFGNPETTPGGKSLPFYASYRISMRKADTEREDVASYAQGKAVKVKQITRIGLKAALEKSKLSSPHRETYFVWDLRKGEVDTYDYAINKAAELGLIKVSKKGQQLQWEYEGVSGVGLKRFRAAMEKADKMSPLIEELLVYTESGPDK